MTAERSPRGVIARQVASVSLAVIPFAMTFGVASAAAGLHAAEAMGFSVLVFAGSAQFAAVTILSDGGTIGAAVVSGILLNLRTLAFGVVMAPALRGPVWWRALVSQVMVDEAAAIGSAQQSRQWQRFGYLATGVTLFVLWNLATLFGVAVLGSADDLIETAGFDATIPATFLALLWPRLLDQRQRMVAVLGAVIAISAAPVLPAGLPIIAATAAVLVLRPWRVQQ